MAQRTAGELAQAIVGLDRADVGAQTVSEAVRVGEVGSCPQAGLLDGLGKHAVDVEINGSGFGEFQDLTLHVGQPGRSQVVEVDVVDRRTHRNPSSTRQ